MRAFGALVGVLLNLTASSADDTGHGTWGPLAVLDEEHVSTVLMALGGTGHLVINDRCVILRLDRSRDQQPPVREKTLVWRSGQVSWDADAGEIVFHDFGHGQLRLADGDRITVGGAPGFGYSDPGESEPDYHWLAEPAESCPNIGWNVHGVTPENEWLY